MTTIFLQQNERRKKKLNVRMKRRELSRHFTFRLFLRIEEGGGKGRMREDRKEGSYIRRPLAIERRTLKTLDVKRKGCRERIVKPGGRRRCAQYFLEIQVDLNPETEF